MIEYHVKVFEDRTEWYFEDKLHRTDGPALEFAAGDKYWYFEGKLHRIDGPAIERADGTKEWYFEDKLHRADGPAVESRDGTKAWYFENKRHRIDGPAIERADGTKEWYFEGKRHRIDGPAIEYAHGTKVWWFEGKQHRIDGPAVEYADGDKAWYMNDVEVTEEEVMNSKELTVAQIGKLIVPTYLVHSEIEALGEALASINFVPIRVEHLYAMDCFEMLGCSKNFDEIEDARIPPIYDIVIHKDEKGNFIRIGTVRRDE